VWIFAVRPACVLDTVAALVLEWRLCWIQNLLTFTLVPLWLHLGLGRSETAEEKGPNNNAATVRNALSTRTRTENFSVPTSAVHVKCSLCNKSVQIKEIATAEALWGDSGPLAALFDALNGHGWLLGENISLRV
jgi:hypothetical protein